MALQVCTAGNLRTTLLCATLAQRHHAFDRLIVATDTPTGSGIMPLGMLYTMSHLASLGGIAPELCIAAATGSNARVYGLDIGLLAAGKAADIVLLDAPDGGTQHDALAAIRNGDIAAVGAVITAGEPRFVGQEPQHAGHHAQHPGRDMQGHARLLGRAALIGAACANRRSFQKPFLHPTESNRQGEPKRCNWHRDRRNYRQSKPRRGHQRSEERSSRCIAAALHQRFDHVLRLVFFIKAHNRKQDVGGRDSKCRS